MTYTIKQLKGFVRSTRFQIRNKRCVHPSSFKTKFTEAFGVGTGRPVYVSYKECCKIVQKAGVKTSTEFNTWTKPAGVPSLPSKAYKNSGWVNWYVFLGTGTGVMVSYKECQKLAREADIKTKTEFKAWDRPAGVPSNPNTVYNNAGWVNWYVFFGTGAGVMVSYNECCKIVRKAGIKTQLEYKAWKKPDGVPSNPSTIYANSGWVNLAVFLRTGVGRRISMSYQECQKITQKAGIKTQLEYKAWGKPDGVPSNPDATYVGSGWVNWKTFLGGL